MYNYGILQFQLIWECGGGCGRSGRGGREVSEGGGCMREEGEGWEEGVGGVGGALVLAIMRTVFFSAWRLLQNHILTTSLSYPNCSPIAVISAPTRERRGRRRGRGGGINWISEKKEERKEKKNSFEQKKLGDFLAFSYFCIYYIFDTNWDMLSLFVSCCRKHRLLSLDGSIWWNCKY